jgi:hypothetical protein
MAGTWPITYHELYADPTNNPFGNDEEVVEVCTHSVYKLFRATGLLLDKDDLLHNTHAYFCGLGSSCRTDPPPLGSSERFMG